MIEFRASCGHSVRARDSDAGNEIRCKYCGQMVRVPVPEATGLEHLLGDEEGSSVRGRKGTTGEGQRGHSIDVQTMLGGPQVYRIAMYLVWAAVVLAVLVIGLRLASKNLFPLITGGDKGEPQPSKTPAAQVAPDEGGTDKAAGSQTWGGGRNLLAALKQGETGLLVNSVPEGLSLRIEWKSGGRRPSGMPVSGVTPMHRTLGPGTYRVSVWISSHDERMLSTPDYGRWFKRVEENRAIPSDWGFFLNDEAKAFEVELRPDGPWRFRRDYEVTVEAGEWRLLCAPYVPNVGIEEQLSYLPAGPQYALNTSQTEDYLDLRQVHGAQRDVLCKVLERMGKAFWRDPTGVRYMFCLQANGKIWARLMGEEEIEPLAVELPAAPPSYLADYTLADLDLLLYEARALATVVVLLQEYDRRREPCPIEEVARFLPAAAPGEGQAGSRFGEWREASQVDRVRLVELLANQPDLPSTMLQALALALHQDQGEKDAAVALVIVDLLAEHGDPKMVEHLQMRREQLEARPASADRTVELARLDEAMARLAPGGP